MTKTISEANKLITFNNSQGIGARGTLLKISHNHIVFETYNPYSIVQLSEVLDNLTVFRFNEKIYVGRAVVSNLINTGLILIVSATLVDPWSEKIKIDQLTDLKSEACLFVSDWNDLNNKIATNYQLAVNKLRSFLIETNRWLGQFDTLSNLGTKQVNSMADKDLVEKISEPILVSLTELLLKFEEERRSVDETKEGICKRFAQQELHPLIMPSPFAHRTFSKPLGYAGDYEMVNMMLRNPYEGETVYAKLLNFFLLSRGPAEAHRNRIDILYDRILKIANQAKSEGRIARIFNFACGPAIELQRFIENEELSENCHFTLLDFSKETLEYTEKMLMKAKQNGFRKQVRIDYIHKSVNEVLKQSIGLKEKAGDNDEEFDFVYCAGLFDYLSDKICSRMLKLFFHQLKPGGLLLATNVHSNNPVKALMEHLLEWYLIYRDENNFPKLIDTTTKKDIYTDKTGFNIFLETTKDKT